MTSIQYTALDTPPTIPTDENGYATTAAFNNFVDNVTW